MLIREPHKFYLKSNIPFGFPTIHLIKGLALPTLNLRHFPRNGTCLILSILKTSTRLNRRLHLYIFYLFIYGLLKKLSIAQILVSRDGMIDE